MNLASYTSATDDDFLTAVQAGNTNLEDRILENSVADE